MEFRPGRQETPRGNTSSSCRSKRMGRGSKTNNNRQSVAAVADVRVMLSGGGWDGICKEKGFFFFWTLCINYLKRDSSPRPFETLLFWISLWGKRLNWASTQDVQCPGQALLLILVSCMGLDSEWFVEMMLRIIREINLVDGSLISLVVLPVFL